MNETMYMKKRLIKLVVTEGNKILQIVEAKVAPARNGENYEETFYRVHFMIDQELEEGFTSEWTDAGLANALFSCDVDGVAIKTEIDGKVKTDKQRLKEFKRSAPGSFWRRKPGTYYVDINDRNNYEYIAA